MSAAFQDRLLDALMPEKLIIKEAPAIVEDVAPAAGSTAPRLSAARTKAAAEVKASAATADKPDWRGTCAICLDLLPLESRMLTLFTCCCTKICTQCADKCIAYNGMRCPLCRTQAPTSDAEWRRRIQKHVHEGNAEAQSVLGDAYRVGGTVFKKNSKRAAQLYQLAAAQGHADAQSQLGICYLKGDGVKIDYKTAARWIRAAAEQGYPSAQCNLGKMCVEGTGVAQSNDEAIKWLQLAAAQDYSHVLYILGCCRANGKGVPHDHEALCCYKRAAAKGYDSAAAIAWVEARLAATSGPRR